MKKYLIGLAALFAVLYTLKGVFILDPDLGWQIRIGQYILSHGIPTTDPLSFSMANYPYRDHSWLTSVVIFLLYSCAGLTWLSFGFAVLAVAAVYLRLKNFAYSLFPAFIILSVLISLTGIRAQVVSWVMFSLLLLIAETAEKNRLYGLLFIPLMAAWVNLHGGYSLGLGIIGLLFIASSIKAKRPDIFYGAVFLFSLAATGINPYGYRIWSVVFTTVGSPLTYMTISEWKPAFFFLQIPYWLFFGLATSLVILSWRRTPLIRRALFVALMLFSIVSIRNVPYFLLFLLPIWAGEYPRVEQAILSRRGAEKRYKKVLKVFFIVFAAILILQGAIDVYSISSSFESKMYPQQAVIYMKKNGLTGRVFALYGWGGYLLWKYPAARPYIDGRMPEWRWRQSDPRYTGNAYKEYYEILNGIVPVSILEKKYGVKYALLPNTQIGSRPGRNPFAGKRILYKDGTAVIYLLE